MECLNWITRWFNVLLTQFFNFGSLIVAPVHAATQPRSLLLWEARGPQTGFCLLWNRSFGQSPPCCRCSCWDSRAAGAGCCPLSQWGGRSACQLSSPGSTAQARRKRTALWRCCSLLLKEAGGPLVGGCRVWNRSIGRILLCCRRSRLGNHVYGWSPCSPSQLAGRSGCPLSSGGSTAGVLGIPSYTLFFWFVLIFHFVLDP